MLFSEAQHTISARADLHDGNASGPWVCAAPSKAQRRTLVTCACDHAFVKFARISYFNIQLRLLSLPTVIFPSFVLLLVWNGFEVAGSIWGI